VAGVANNHTANHGRAGFDTTRYLLEEADIASVGDPSGITDVSVWRTADGGNSLSLIAVNVFDGDLTGLTELIVAEATAGQFVIVLPHWGNEYQTSHSARQEQLATDWVNAGARLIIGAHPHVVQDAQIITAPNGEQAVVLYSLGNFIFDQTFSQETQQGLIVAGSVSPEQLQVVLQPIVSRQLRPELAWGETKQAIIDRVCASLGEACSAGTITVTY
jgi:poly-gamma-glutamate synthesis protein (capsule biosynthesis protein)